MLPNLQHQHSRVRLIVIEALGALVSGGCVPAGLVESLVCPALRPVAYDRAPAVREALFAAIAKWMGGSGDSSSVNPASGPKALTSLSTAASLLPLLLVGVTDPQPSLASAALQLVEAVGCAWVDRHGGPGRAEGNVSTSQPMEGVEPAAGEDEERAAKAAAACQLGPPYSGRPGPGARGMVRELLHLLLRPLLAEVGEWTVALRATASRQLHTVLVLGEAGVTPQLPRLLPALCSAIGDEDAEVAGRIISAVHVVGAHVEPRLWLPLMLDNVTKWVPVPLSSGFSPCFMSRDCSSLQTNYITFGNSAAHLLR